MEDNPFPAVMGRVCYHPCETACNRGQLDEAVGINSVERFLGDEAIRQGWTRRRRRAEPTGKRVLVVGAGPVRARRPPTTSRASATRSTIRDAGPDGRRHDALRHPALPAAARRARRRGRSASSTLGVDARAEHARSTDSSTTMREGGFDAAFLAVGAHIGKRAYIPAGDGRARSSTPSRCCAAWRARSSRCSAGASSSTAAATPRWTPPARPSASAPRRRSSSTAARATGCPRTTSRSRRPRRRAC